MKTKITILAFVLLGLLFNGCSVTSGVLGNSTQTQVVLKGNNYKVLESVTGQASASYIFFIGKSAQNVVDRARRDMIQKANLTGSSKAIINITVDTRFKVFLIWYMKTVYVSGDVIMFVDK